MRRDGERLAMHGGVSTRPRTSEGLERLRWLRWKDGRRSAEAIARRAKLAANLRDARIAISGKRVEQMPPRVKALVKPELLVWARESAGFLLLEAAAKLGIVEDRLAAWESGTDAPSIPQLRKLAALSSRSAVRFHGSQRFATVAGDGIPPGAAGATVRNSKRR